MKRNQVDAYRVYALDTNGTRRRLNVRNIIVELSPGIEVEIDFAPHPTFAGHLTILTPPSAAMERIYEAGHADDFAVFFRSIERASRARRAAQAQAAKAVREEVIQHMDDVLVNHAGGGLATKLADVTAAEFDERLAFNARSAFFGMQEAALHMGSGGRIINVSATVTRMRVAGAMVYAGAKGAMEQLTRHAALELGERGITVNTVSRGVATDVFKAHAPEAQRRAAMASPLGRLGTPEDIADVVAFLASEASRWVTGQNLCVDGGAGT
jgi:3-oxoacyl-[acyl-carrier protein] reductase